MIRYKVNDQESVIQVDRFPYLIGRDSSSVQLALPDATVSRTHARLTYQDGAVWLENVSTTNKTAVNGQYIQQPIQLSTGDKALLGSSQLFFEIQFPPVPEGTQPQPVKAAPVMEAEPVSAPTAPSYSASKNALESEACFCQKCGSPLRRGAVSCAECGAVVSREIMGKTMFCGSCGAKVSENTKFCPMCGKSTKQSSGGSKESHAATLFEPHSEAKQKRGKFSVPAVASALIVVAIVIAAFIMFGGRSYEKQLVGSWYREGDSRPVFTLYDDGTCEIAYEYGTGRWAVVNDGKLKLTNFYGESETKAIESLKNGCLTMEDGTVYWSSPQ